MEFSIIKFCEDYQYIKLNTYTDKQKKAYEKFIKKTEDDFSRFNLENMNLEDFANYADDLYINMHQVLLTKITDLELYIKNMLEITNYDYSLIIKLSYSLSRLQHSHENYYIYLKRYRHIKNTFINSTHNIIKVPSYRIVTNKV